MNQKKIPILHMLEEFQEKKPVSFHVPGHKHGAVFPNEALDYYKDILRLDVTELPGLDDLHAPEGAIREAEELAGEFFQSDYTFFLVGGSTSGNLAMILSVCHPGDKILVQRNSHKSIMNGLELAGATPVFLSPEYDERVKRYTSPSIETVKAAIEAHPDAKALVLTYPDYFGRTYEIEKMISLAHDHRIPVLVDEAHGVHFTLGQPFPMSSLQLGADVVVHSAHKTAPAMTMASYMHVKSDLVSKDALAYRLQMLQSSSPSYPLMASLDIARAFLASQSSEQLTEVLESAERIKVLFEGCNEWEVIHTDDPIKLTIQSRNDATARYIATLFEEEGIYPELVTDKQVLFIFGLAPFTQWDRLKKVVQSVREKLKKQPNHATIDIMNLFTKPIQELTLSYREMQGLKQRLVPLEESIGKIAAEPVIPYPPGIPFILKGERITHEHLDTTIKWMEQGVRIQQRQQGIQIFEEDEGEMRRERTFHHS